MKLLAPFSVSNSSKLTFSILANKLVLRGVISVEKVSLEDLVGSNFYCEWGCTPPTIPADIEVGRGGEDAITEDEGNRKGGESTATNIQTKVGYEGVNPPPPPPPNIY